MQYNLVGKVSVLTDYANNYILPKRQLNMWYMHDPNEVLIIGRDI